MRTFLIFAIIFAVMFSSCDPTDDKENSSKIPFNGARWADSVVGMSSEYYPAVASWNAVEALGEPNVYPDYGDIPYAWTSQTQDGQREYLELGFFSNPQPVASIAIFETYNPGAIDTLYVMNPNNNLWEIVWSDSAHDRGDSSRIFIASFAKTPFNVSVIRIAINSPKVISWNEIDAVAMAQEEIPPFYDDSTGFYSKD
ncbi:hypothetical protein L6Q79_12865 [bacterium]|nr:hypothetical protein [bacterium]NUN46374.1 hypothetical protein [bacterium]